MQGSVRGGVGRPASLPRRALSYCKQHLHTDDRKRRILEEEAFLIGIALMIVPEAKDAYVGRD